MPSLLQSKFGVIHSGEGMASLKLHSGEGMASLKITITLILKIFVGLCLSKYSAV